MAESSFALSAYEVFLSEVGVVPAVLFSVLLPMKNTIAKQKKSDGLGFLFGWDFFVWLGWDCVSVFVCVCVCLLLVQFGQMLIL